MREENFPVDFGHYRLLRKVAQGGMAEIFLAQDRDGRVCAVKRILPHLAHEESFIRMFIDEARIVSHLDHPNIARVYEQGKLDGYYYIAMEFVQGHSLLALSERAKSMKMALPRGLLAYVVAELLAGLGCAHSARDHKGRHLGIVHRDVTPQNVLISYDGEVKLIDFGVAKARARLTQTEAGFTKGKLSYMSPEQARGEELDGRSDLFSVGIIVHEITTNTRLFNKEGPGGVLGAIVNDPIPPPSQKVKDYPKELEGVVMRALAKDVSARWQTAEEMREALLRFGKQEKPVPSRMRLRDLVHDLFGEPEDQKFIDAALSVVAPMSPEPRALSLPAGAPVHLEKAAGALSSGTRTAGMPGRDDTRMLGVEHELRASRVSRKLEVTGDAIPSVSMPIPREEFSVPEPVLPFRVRLARFLADLAVELKSSLRLHRRRWVLGSVGSIALLLLLVVLEAGVIGWARTWLGGAADRARALKASAGLTEASVDSGARAMTVLRLSSEPPGAAISVDGLGMGAVTPQDLTNLPTGRPLKVELSLPGYRPEQQTVTLFEGQGLRELTVALVRLEAALEILSEPSGAEAWVNGLKQPQTTPLRVDKIPAGRPIEVKLIKRGHLPQERVVLLTGGEERKLSFELPVDVSQIPPGKLSVTTTPPGCEVLIDAQPAGTSPLAEHSVKAGPHEVRVRCAYYAEETRAVSVGAGKASRVEFTMRPTVFGYLTVVPVPSSGVQVFINGKAVSVPVESLKVIPGRHVILVKDRNTSRELSVDVGPEQRILREVQLYR